MRILGSPAIAATAVAIFLGWLGYELVGGGSHVLPPPNHTQTVCAPDDGGGVMGVCLHRARPTVGPPRTLHGPFVVDVSEFQGRPNWRAARWHISGAVVRVADMVTGHPDRSLAYNWKTLDRLHVWHAAYAFLRPGNCTAEGVRAVNYVNAVGGLHSGPLIADSEVPMSSTCTTDFTRTVERHTKWRVCVIYSAKGTWPGGYHDGCSEWDAAYGPVPGCIWTCARVAWQFTDGELGPFPHRVPGISGPVDISADTGLTGILRRSGPSPLTRRLHAAYRQRASIEALRAKHDCATKPKPKRYRQACLTWQVEQRKVQRTIAHLHRLGAY